jgi:hypothetical protein
MGMTDAERSRRWREAHPDRAQQVKASFRARNRTAIREADRAKSVRTRAERRAWLDALKVERGCSDCGYNTHPRALDWDHIGSDKLGDVGRLAHSRIAMPRLLAEIAKCEVVCANCHRIRTWRREQTGTGTTALAASTLGRVGISVDLSGDYCRIARWRTTDPGERARAARKPRPDPVPAGQLDLWTDAS